MEGALGVVELAAASVPADFVRRAEAELDRSYSLAGYLLGSAVDAEDAVQDALIKAWRSWSGLREPERFAAWFDRIVVHVCRDRMRRHRTVRMVALEAAGDAVDGDPFREMLAADAVAAAVSRLSPDHRIVVVLRFWRDLPLDAIAERLDLPLGTVKSRLHYALRALRAELDGTET